MSYMIYVNFFVICQSVSYRSLLNWSLLDLLVFQFMYDIS